VLGITPAFPGPPDHPLLNMPKKTLRDIELNGKRVLVRVDFNVPLDEQDGRMVITDDTRIRETLPTLNALLEKGAKVILCSHLGRPKGKPDPRQSLAPVAPALSALLGRPVAFAADCIGDEAGAKAAALQPGEVLLLENTRFHAGEEDNDRALAAGLAGLAEIFVNDAFGSAHRAHSSTAGVADLLPSVSGLLMEKELAWLHDELENPGRPFVVILGGAKVSDKIEVVESLLAKCDVLCIGGAMANTFLAAQGLDMQKSLVEADKLPLARTIMEKARDKKVKLILPVDLVVADGIDATAGETVETTAVPAGKMALDVGPKTVALVEKELVRAQTVLWNGPMGLFESKPFAEGTLAVARALAKVAGFTVVGGGDSAAAVKLAGEDVVKGIDHISTGGGASLELIEGKKLPGVAALEG